MGLGEGMRDWDDYGDDFRFLEERESGRQE